MWVKANLYPLWGALFFLDWNSIFSVMELDWTTWIGQDSFCFYQTSKFIHQIPSDFFHIQVSHQFSISEIHIYFPSATHSIGHPSYTGHPEPGASNGSHTGNGRGATRRARASRRRSMSCRSATARRDGKRMEPWIDNDVC